MTGVQTCALPISGINDGATAALLMSAERAESLGLRPRARMIAYAFAGVAPEIMGYGPVPSTEKALAKAGISRKARSAKSEAKGAKKTATKKPAAKKAAPKPKAEAAPAVEASAPAAAQE